MTTTGLEVRQGSILTGAKFGEPMRVINEPRRGDGYLVVDLVGTRSSAFRGGVLLTSEDLQQINVESPATGFRGNANLFRLGIEAIRIGLAYEYDPFFGLSMSRVDPLPHQVDAVYNHMLKAWRVRFLLADDAGAGKTIMAGLLLKELKLRGLAERVLIVCPANLAFQWRRELRDKFEEYFEPITGARLREAYSVNVWNQYSQIITSMDLAKLDYVLPGVQQADDWDLVIVDEAHRMSASDADHKSERYRLGELLRDKSAHLVLLTATPHKGDPENFCLFLQLLDKEAYADVKSIQEAMQRREAPFYLRRTKEAMLSFPTLQPDGTWKAKPLFKRRIPKTVPFTLTGAEWDLYRAVTRYVQFQSQAAASRAGDRRASAVGFLMAMYQRRMASSTYALKESLRRRHKKLKDLLDQAGQLADLPVPEMPSADEWEEMDAASREEIEHRLEQVTLARRKPELQAELREIEGLIAQAEHVLQSGQQEKLQALKQQLTEQGVFADRATRLLLFTEYKDTLDYLVKMLQEWGLSVGYIHGGMESGNRDKVGTRLHAERQFWDLKTQVLVATEAAGEGINLQCCNVLFNYDIPWNPNRLEQRMGRIHRYGQTKDCFIFNFFARNTVEGRVLEKLLDRLQEIRDALEDDAVFNVVGEVLPSNQIERLLRDYYAGQLGEEDIHNRLEVQVNREDFERICRSALESLARRSLNLPMLVEQRAQAQERRIVPETVARFFAHAADRLGVPLTPLKDQPRSFRVGRLPLSLNELTRSRDWRLPPLAKGYDRITFDRDVAGRDPKLEWVTPGHPLFEAIRRKTENEARPHLREGVVLYDLDREEPTLLELFTASVVDGTGKTLHQRLFVVETTPAGDKRLRELSYILGLEVPRTQPEIGPLPATDTSPAYLYTSALRPFLADVAQERQRDLDTIERHVRLCFDELIEKRNEVLGRHLVARDQGDPSAEGLVEIESQKLLDLQRRRDARTQELARQRALSLQGIERLGVALVLPHPERVAPEATRLRPNPETERRAMAVSIAHEQARGCRVEDVHQQDLGYDLRSLHPETGELRLIEVKGLGGSTGVVALTPNEKRVAEDRPDVYWLYVVTDCDTFPALQEPVPNPARLDWHPVTKIERYQLTVNAVTRPMTLREDQTAYEGTP